MIILKSSYIKLLSILIISCLGILIYSNSLFCSYHFDDFRFIVNNPVIKNIQNWPGIWHYFHGRFIAFLSFALNYHIDGLNVLGFHLFNLAVHLVAAILVWWLMLLTLSTPSMKEDKINQHAHIIALMAGLVFVSHPIQVEAVTNIWQRAASMAAMFYLASLCFYVKSRCSEGSSGRLYYIFSLIFAVAAMFTKENAVTLPLIVLFYEFSFLTSKNTKFFVPMRRDLIPFLFALLIVPITFLFIKTQVFQGMHGDLKVPGGVITTTHYFWTQFRVMVTYLRLSFFPLNQRIDYDYPIFKNIFELPVWTSLLFLIVILYWAKFLISKYKLLTFSIFLFFLTLTIPESSFWAMGDVISEHRLYLPLAGYSMFLVGGAYYLFGRNTIKTMVVVLMMIITVNAFLTYQRNKIWKNEFTLWNDAAIKSPHKARPYNNRGVSYAAQGDFIKAILDFNQAIAINPDYADAYNDRGVAYASQGDFIWAIPDFKKAIAINPLYTAAYDNLASVYDKQGNFPGAITDYGEAIKLGPDDAQRYYNRGVDYAKLNKFTQAISDYNKAIEIEPNYAEAYNNRGFIYAVESNLSRAIFDFNQAITLKPDYADARKNQAECLSELKKYAPK